MFKTPNAADLSRQFNFIFAGIKESCENESTSREIKNFIWPALNLLAFIFELEHRLDLSLRKLVTYDFGVELGWNVRVDGNSAIRQLGHKWSFWPITPLKKIY
jgi:hypothetical protein